VRLRIRRLGGIAGIALQAELDTGDLPAIEAAGVERALGRLRGAAPTGPPQPDAFRYEIVPLDDPAAAVVLDQRDVPAELTGLVEEVGRSGRPRRRGPAERD
jgi:Emfourin